MLPAKHNQAIVHYMGRADSFHGDIPYIRTLSDPLYQPVRSIVFPLCPPLMAERTRCASGSGVFVHGLLDLHRAKKLLELLEGCAHETHVTDSDRKRLQTAIGAYSSGFRAAIRAGFEQPGTEEHLQYVHEVAGASLKLRHTTAQVISAYLREDEVHSLGTPSTERDFYMRTWNERMAQLASLCDFSAEHRVTCPLADSETCVACGMKSGSPYFLLTEESRAMELLDLAMSTFEVNRCRWLFMTGSLHLVRTTATHTRMAHMTGCAIVAINALRYLQVVRYGDVAHPLGTYLTARGIVHEFVIAALLHDVGHPPLSHVLEVNPAIRLDHEAITLGMVLGRPAGWKEGDIRAEGEEPTDWHSLSYYFQRLRHFQLEHHAELDDLIRQRASLSPGSEEMTDWLEKKRSLEQRVREGNARKDGVRTIHDQLDLCGLSSELIADILTPVDPAEDKEQLRSDAIVPGFADDVSVLRTLIHSDIDLDRMDHVKRDSMFAGESLTSFRLRDLLQDMTIVYQDTTLGRSIRETNEEAAGRSPDESKLRMNPLGHWFVLSELGVMYVLDLLRSREEIFNRVLYSNENTFLNGVVNQLTERVLDQRPHIELLLPLITDQHLHHYLAHERANEEVRSLLSLLRIARPSDHYFAPIRWQLLPTTLVADRDDIRRLYERLRAFSRSISAGLGADDSDNPELPPVVFYTNIRMAESTDPRDRERAKLVDMAELPGFTPAASAAGPLYVQGRWDPWLVLRKPMHEPGASPHTKCEIHCISDLAARKEYSGGAEPFPDKPSGFPRRNVICVWIRKGLSSRFSSEKEAEARDGDDASPQIQEPVDVRDELEKVVRMWVEEIVEVSTHGGGTVTELRTCPTG